MKIKSFGLIEAMIASFIAITVLSGAVALASSVNESTTTDSSYSQAEQIADNFLENLNFANSLGVLFFDTRTLPVGSGIFSIECFNTDPTKSITAKSCRGAYTPSLHPDFVDFYWNSNRTERDTSDPGYYKINKDEINNGAFSPGFFKIKTTINTPVACKTVAGVAIPANKCRVVDVEIKWSENVGDQTYRVSRYITDWTR